MKKNPLVSVIMNVHNGEKYLKESINSIIAQTYKNWELIFWDNNSSDNSKNIFFEYKDKRLKYFFFKKKIKLYESRNLAIKKCKGELIAFLDQDDLWLKNKLKKQVELFNNKDVGLVYSNYYKWDEKKLIFKKKLFSNNRLPEGKITDFLLKKYVVGICTIIIKKSFLVKKKVFNPRYNMLADFLFVLNFSLHTNFRCVQQPLAIYRYHGSQMSNIFFNNTARDFTKLLNTKNEINKFKKFNNFIYLIERVKFIKTINFLEKGKKLIALKNLLSFSSNITKTKIILRIILSKKLYHLLFGQFY